MKQRDLVKKLEDSGFAFERHGSNHDIYTSVSLQVTRQYVPTVLETKAYSVIIV